MPTERPPLLGDRKLVVVCRLRTEDTNIETPNEISEVALKTSNPAEWEITPDLIHHFVKHIPSQSIESDLFLKDISYGDKVGYAWKEYFIRRLTNGEIVQRDWLIYFPSTASFSVTMNIFGILRAIYVVVFSMSPWRWSILLQNMEENTGVVKSLSDSRLSARNGATNALFFN
jgi:hypothetical protein